MRVRPGSMLGNGCRVGRIAVSVVSLARVVPLGINHDLWRVGGLCAPNSTSAPAYPRPPNWRRWRSTVELLFSEHCCCYGSKPGCLLGAFWLFSSSPKTSWAEKIKFCQKELLYGGPQLKYRSQSTAATMELSKCGWSWGPFGCSCMTAAIQAGYTKNSRSGFIFLPKSFFCQRLKFSLESIPEDASIAPMMASYG